MCCSLGMSSQSKQHIVSPVRNLVPLLASNSSILEHHHYKHHHCYHHCYHQYSLDQGVGQRCFAVVISLEQHQLELTVDILNLLVHFLQSSNIHSMSHHKKFAITWSGTKRLCPPGIFFMMCLSMRSFSRTATPLSIRIGGCAACKHLSVVISDARYSKHKDWKAAP